MYKRIMKLLLFLFLVGYSEATSFFGTQGTSQMEVLNVASFETLKKLQKNLKDKEASSSPTARKGISGMVGSMFSGLKNTISGPKVIEPQADLDELSILYQAMNYADIAALDYLKKNCRSGGLFEPTTDPHLCGTYLVTVVKSVESRLSSLTSQYLFSDGFLKAPEEWPQHAFEMYKQLDSYANTPGYSSERVLIKNAKDIADGKAAEDYAMAVPQYSPLAALWSPVIVPARNDFASNFNMLNNRSYSGGMAGLDAGGNASGNMSGNPNPYNNSNFNSPYNSNNYTGNDNGNCSNNNNMNYNDGNMRNSSQQMIPMVLVPASALPCGVRNGAIDPNLLFANANMNANANTNANTNANANTNSTSADNSVRVSEQVNNTAAPSSSTITTTSENSIEHAPASTNTTAAAPPSSLLSSMKSRVGRLFSRQ